MNSKENKLSYAMQAALIDIAKQNAFGYQSKTYKALESRGLITSTKALTQAGWQAVLHIANEQFDATARRHCYRHKQRSAKVDAMNQWGTLATRAEWHIKRVNLHDYWIQKKVNRKVDKCHRIAPNQPSPTNGLNPTKIGSPLDTPPLHTQHGLSPRSSMAQLRAGTIRV